MSIETARAKINAEANGCGGLEKAIAARGLAPRKTLNQGGSDANVYNSRGLPSVVVGCGMHDVHGTSEYADLGEMADCAGIVLAAITGQE